MKVYCVFYFNGLEDVMDKVFADKKKAQAYVKHKRLTTDYGWFNLEMEVEE